MTQEINLYTEAGNTFSYSFQILDDSGNPLNLNGYTIRASLTKDYGSTSIMNFIIHVTDSVNGKVTLNLSSNQTYTLASGKFYFDCQYVSPDFVSKYVKGILTVYPTVSAPPDFPASGSYVTSTFTMNFSPAKYNQTLTIVDSRVNTSSVITAQAISSGINADELEMDSILLQTTAQNGSFVIYADTFPGPVWGDYTIQYTIYTP